MCLFYSILIITNALTSAVLTYLSGIVEYIPYTIPVLYNDP